MTSPTVTAVSDERLRELRRKFDTMLGGGTVITEGRCVEVLAVIDELLRARKTQHAYDEMIAAQKLRKSGARSALADVGECEWHNRPDLDFVRYKSGAISEKCPKCSRYSPECASPGSCHYDGKQPRPAAEAKCEACFTAKSSPRMDCAECAARVMAESPAAHTAQDDAKAMRCYYVTAHVQGFVNSPLWHELAEEARETYRQHVSRLAEHGSGAKP